LAEVYATSLCEATIRPVDPYAVAFLVIVRPTMNLSQALRVLTAFARHRVEYAVFGAVALNLHGIGRSTEDLDVFVRPDSVNLLRMKEALRAVFADPNLDELNVEELLGDYPAVRYYPPEEGGFYLDVLTRLGEAYLYEDLEIEEVEIEGQRIRVITPQMLYRMKKNTVRLKDRADAALVREKFELEE
jgi:hypothetical protein